MGSGESQPPTHHTPAKTSHTYKTTLTLGRQGHSDCLPLLFPPPQSGRQLGVPGAGGRASLGVGALRGGPHGLEKTHKSDTQKDGRCEHRKKGLARGECQEGRLAFICTSCVPELCWAARLTPASSSGWATPPPCSCRSLNALPKSIHLIRSRGSPAPAPTPARSHKASGHLPLPPPHMPDEGPCPLWPYWVE